MDLHLYIFGVYVLRDFYMGIRLMLLIAILISILDYLRISHDYPKASGHCKRLLKDILSNVPSHGDIYSGEPDLE